MPQFHEIDIPTAAMLEHEIFMESVSKSVSIDEASRNILRSKGLAEDSIPRPPYLQVRILSLLYCLVVFPKELYKNSEAESAFLEVLGKDEEFVEFCQCGVQKFIRAARNSISHSRVTVTPEGRVCLIDKKRNGEIWFERTLEYNEVEYFLSKMGSVFDHLRQEETRESIIRNMGS
jgi:hypothetical protein